MDFSGLVCGQALLCVAVVIPMSAAWIARAIFSEIYKQQGKNLSNEGKSQIFIIVFVIVLIATCLVIYYTTKDFYVM